MNLKKYLSDTFKFNESANLKLLKQIKELPDKTEASRLFSHLIISQNNWLKRIQNENDKTVTSWFEPEIKFDELEEKWKASNTDWIDFLNSKSEDEIYSEIVFYGSDGISKWEVPIADIALQLCYHSFHHRGQIQAIIRRQGLTPAFLDYIGTKGKRLN